jgi:AsmA protein
MKWFKRTALVLVALLLLAGAGLVFLAASFDANRYKPMAVDWMKTSRNRTLVIGGPIQLSVFPRIGLKVSELSLSEPGRPDLFAEVRALDLALDVLPLLHGEIVVDKVSAQGVRLRYLREASGVRNLDDLLDSQAGGKPAEPGPASARTAPLRLDISAISLSDLRLAIDDRQARLKGDVTLDSLKTGRIGAGVESPVDLQAKLAFSEPAMAATLSGQTRLLLNPAATGSDATLALRDAALKLDGDLPGFKGARLQLGGSVQLAKGAWKAEALKLTASGQAAGLNLSESQLSLDSALLDVNTGSLKLSQLAFSAKGARQGEPLELQLKWPQLDASAERLQGSALSGLLVMGGPTPLQAQFSSGQPSGNFRQVRVPQLRLAFEGSAGAQASGQIQTDLLLSASPLSVALDNLAGEVKAQAPGLAPQVLAIKGKLNASAQQAAVEVSGQWASGGAPGAPYAINATAQFGAVTTVNARLQLAALDIDRLRGHAPAPATPAKPEAGGAPPDTPVDMDAAAVFHGSVQADIGTLTANHIRFSDVHLAAIGTGKLLTLQSFSAGVWGGKVQGSGTVDPLASRISLDAVTQGVRIEQAMKDLSGRDTVEGSGQLNLNLQASGKTVAQMKSSLSGRLRVALRDGAVKGINLAKSLRDAKAALSLQKDQSSQANAGEKTDFSEILASFDIAQGVARNNDLSGKSPFLRLAGSGEIDVGRSTINYTARAVVTDNAQGQGGAELAMLRGVEVPVRLTGPLQAMQYQIQWSAVTTAVAKEALKGKLGDELRKKLGLPGGAATEGNPASGAKPESANDRLKNQLKGLFR